MLACQESNLLPEAIVAKDKPEAGAAQPAVAATAATVWVWVCVFKHPAVFVTSASPVSLFGVFVAPFPLVADTSIDSIHQLTHVDVDAHSHR